jgi:hypothetical protein
MQANWSPDTKMNTKLKELTTILIDSNHSELTQNMDYL